MFNLQLWQAKTLPMDGWHTQWGKSQILLNVCKKSFKFTQICTHAYSDAPAQRNVETVNGTNSDLPGTYTCLTGTHTHTLPDAHTRMMVTWHTHHGYTPVAMARRVHTHKKDKNDIDDILTKKYEPLK